MTSVKFFGFVGAVWLLCTSQAFAQEMAGAPEGFPQELAQRLMDRHSAEQQAGSKIGLPVANYILNRRRWERGSTLLVAFQGGTPALHRAIADVAQEWSKSANIRFDFGYNSATGKYREWSSNDVNYVAHIRVAFDAGGYWSAIGTDSIYSGPNSEYFPPNKPSMNFANFAILWGMGPAAMPVNWKTTVRHEFAHALGFSHEQQQLQCVSEIRWEPGPSGERDVYAVYWEWQKWDRTKVDLNLKPNWQGGADLVSGFDRKSCMLYAQPAEVFKDGVRASCYIPAENKECSPMDRVGARRAYPFPGDPQISTGAPTALEIERAIASASVVLSGTESEAVQGRLKAAAFAERPLLYIQIGSEAQRQSANQLRENGRNAGFIVPAIENVKNKAKIPKQPEVRYFRPRDAEAAQQAAQLIAPSGQAKPVRVVRIDSLAGKVTRNLVEIWLPVND